MQSLATALMLVASLGAGPRRFPYEAVVERNDVRVYSGPGEENYATGLLHRGETVTVLLHEEGGWCKIAPPQGSFNLIPADGVRSVGGNRGEVTDFHVPVYIGSALDKNRFENYHQELSQGDAVEILDKVSAPRSNGRLTAMYVIRPPRGEVRWVKGQLIVPQDGQARRQQDADPFNHGNHFERTPRRDDRGYEDNAFHDDNSQTWDKDINDDHRPPRPDHPHDNDWGDDGHSHPPGGFGKKPVVRTKDGVAVRRNYPEQDEIEADRARLEALDNRFREIIDRDAATWDFRELEHDYRRLQEEVSVPALASQIQLRFGAIDHYRELKHAYRDYIQLTSATSRRDAQLLNVQRIGDPNPGGVASHAVAQHHHPHPPHWGANHQPYPGPVPQYQAAGPAPADAYQAASGPPLAAPLPADESLAMGPSLGGPIPSSDPSVAQPAFAESQQAPPGSPVGPQISPYGEPVPYPPNFQPTGAGSSTTVLGDPAASPSQYPIAPSPGSYVSTQPAPPRPANQFDGAGIIQRAVGGVPGAPQHVLLTPNGRVLAYLEATPGVNLDAYVGRPMGLHGQRVHRPDLQGDLLIVNNAVPVRLKQP